MWQEAVSDELARSSGDTESFFGRGVTRQGFSEV
jgi:hypothetical protein